MYGSGSLNWTIAKKRKTNKKRKDKYFTSILRAYPEMLGSAKIIKSFRQGEKKAPLLGLSKSFKNLFLT